MDKKKPVGWLYKFIVNKHMTGPPKPGQIQIAGVWGDRSNMMHFSIDEPLGGCIWWKAPVYIDEEIFIPITGVRL